MQLDLLEEVFGGAKAADDKDVLEILVRELVWNFRLGGTGCLPVAIYSAPG